MKRILIITEVFPPAFNPRMGYLVKYLPDHNWKATVVTTNRVKENNYGFLVEDKDILRINLSQMRLDSMVKKAWHLITLNRQFFKNSRPFINKIRKNFTKDDFSIILVSVSWDIYILKAARKMSISWNLPLVIDLRDISEQRPVMAKASNGLWSAIEQYLIRSFEARKLRVRNYILSRASAVSSVSPYHVRILQSFNNRIKLIYNGFDPDLFYIYPCTPSERFIIVYTGLVHAKTRDPSLLFDAIRLLDINEIINDADFRIQFYTPQHLRHHILNHPKYLTISKYIDFFNYVDNQLVPSIIRNSSIALVLNSIPDEAGPKGILTTKLFEYLASAKPVLCIRGDGDIMDDIISRARGGVAAQTLNDVYEFILDKWMEWKSRGYTTVNIDKDFINKFSRRAQAKEFVNLFEEVLIRV